MDLPGRREITATSYFSPGLCFRICVGLGCHWKMCEAVVRCNAGCAVRRECWAGGAACAPARMHQPWQQCPCCWRGQVREPVLGVLRRKRLTDQTFPWTSCSAGALLAGGDEGVLLNLGLQHSSGLDASACGQNRQKNITFAALKGSFHLLFTSPPHRKENQSLLLRLCLWEIQG